MAGLEGIAAYAATNAWNTPGSGGAAAARPAVAGGQSGGPWAAYLKASKGLPPLEHQTQGLSGAPSVDRSPFTVTEAPTLQRAGAQKVSGPSVMDFVEAVDAKRKASAAEAQDLMLGRSDNIHQAMLAAEESQLAFTLMVEVRNKLMESFQELMRMQL